MLKIDSSLTASALLPAVERLFALSAAKIRAIENTWKPGEGSPVFTVKGKYTSRGWTEWTQGFQFGSAILQFDATGDSEFLESAARKTVERDGAARHRTSACTTTASTTSAPTATCGG